MAQESLASGTIFRFGLFAADDLEKTLTRNGIRVRIQDQPFRVLIYLLRRSGEIVSREELKQKLWPEGTYVDFDGSINVILKKLRAAIDDDSENPRFIETLPRRGYRFIAPVSLITDDRKVVASEGMLQAHTDVPSLPPAARGLDTNGTLLRSRGVLGVAAVILLAVAAAAGFWFAHRTTLNRPSPSAATQISIPVRRSVAVLGFQNLSGRSDESWLSTACAEMLSTELGADGKLRLVPGEDIANLRLASPWSQTGTLDRQTTARIGTSLVSDLLVLGSYTVVGPSGHENIRFDVRLQDAKSGQILAEFSELGTAQELFHLVSKVGDRLRDRLGLTSMEESDAASVLSAVPLDPEAARFYGLGVAKLRQFDALAARDLLEQTTRVDPKFSLAHAMLARAWQQLGYQSKRVIEAKKALDLSADLPQAERMQVQGDYYESIGQHEQAASIYRALFSLYPDNVEYGLSLAAVELEAGHGSQASETVKRLRQLPSPAADDPRIDLVEAKTVNEIPGSLALIHTAVNKASAQGDKVLYAQARRDECMALLYSDHQEMVPAACNDAYDVFLATGNRAAAADAVRLIADRDGSIGHFDEAVTTYQKALALTEGLGEHEKTGAILNNMAIVFTNQGKLDQAEQLYRQAKSHFEQAGDVANTATALVNIADISYLRGDLPQAERQYQQTLQLQQQLDPGDPGYTLYRLADLELSEGKVKQAELHAQQANAVLEKKKGAYQYATTATVELASVYEAQGDLGKALQLYNQALVIRQKVGEADLVAESQEEIAEVLIEQHQPQKAEPLLRTAIAQFEQDHADPDASSAYILLSRALQAEGRLDEAQQAVQHGTQLSLNSPDPTLRLPAAIQTARLQVAALKVAGPKATPVTAAIQRLNAAEALARAKGYFTIACDARLALAEIEMKIDGLAGRSLLGSLAADARSRGFELIAQNAEETMKTARVETASIGASH